LHGRHRPPDVAAAAAESGPDGKRRTGLRFAAQGLPGDLPGGGRIELSITPRPIPFLQTLRVEVTVSGVEPGKVEVDFAGESMNMGYNRSEFPAAGAGRYVGAAALPVCVSGSMTWVATVIIETDRQRIAVPYRVDVGH
jgi:hypothetical protein